MRKSKTQIFDTLKTMCAEDFWSAYMQTSNAYKDLLFSDPLYVAFHTTLLGRGKDVLNWWVCVDANVEDYEQWLFQMHKSLRAYDVFDDWVSESTLWHLMQDDRVWHAFDTHVTRAVYAHGCGDVVLRWPFVRTEDVVTDGELQRFLDDNRTIYDDVVAKYRSLHYDLAMHVDVCESQHTASLRRITAHRYVKRHNKLYPRFTCVEPAFDAGVYHYRTLQKTCEAHVRADVDVRLRDMALVHFDRVLHARQ